MMSAAVLARSTAKDSVAGSLARHLPRIALFSLFFRVKPTSRLAHVQGAAAGPGVGGARAAVPAGGRPPRWWQRALAEVVVLAGLRVVTLDGLALVLALAQELGRAQRWGRTQEAHGSVGRVPRAARGPDAPAVGARANNQATRSPMGSGLFG